MVKTGTESKARLIIPCPEVLDGRKELESYDEVFVYCSKKTCYGSNIIALGLKLLDVPHMKVYEEGIVGRTEQRLPVLEYAIIMICFSILRLENYIREVLIF